MARYVIPALNGSVTPMQASADYVEENKAELIGGASAAVMSKIMAHEGARGGNGDDDAADGRTAAARKAKNEDPANDPAFRPRRRPAERLTTVLVVLQRPPRSA